MSFVNCIGKFLLFRWLFGLGKRDATEHDMFYDDMYSCFDKVINETAIHII